ncbi:MAG: aminotransferase class V-fold PLP-dependent enzyme [Chloroflexi bacterium]|nr:aminotransferase class V-fold PLP-dependent enzyme [Chloroflexota bacterium]
MKDMDIVEIRKAIPATQKVIYLNTGWSGPSPARVVERIKEWLELESQEGPTSRHVLEASHQTVQEAREAVADLLGVSAEEIALMQNTTQGINIVINGLTWRPGDEMVTTDLEHPAVIVPSYFLGKRRRVKVKVVDLMDVQDEGAILDRLEAAISPRTQLICLSHIMYTDGLRLPLARIQALAHSRGIPVLVDGAQSAGQMPLDLRALDCDFYSLPGHKWLLGPDGTGALFIRKELIPQVRAVNVGHWSVASVERQSSLRETPGEIRKFEVSTTSSALWAGLATTIAFHQFVGPQMVWERVLALSSLLCRELAAVPGARVLSPRGQGLASGLVTFSLEGVEPKEVVDYLWQRCQAVARTVAYPAGVRFSTAFFNTEEEIGKVVECLKGLPRGKGGG